MIVIPAYGRDYKSKKDAESDFRAGKDFQIADVSSRWNGCYISIRDCSPGDKVKIRFNGFTKFVFVTI